MEIIKKIYSIMKKIFENVNVNIIIINGSDNSVNIKGTSGD